MEGVAHDNARDVEEDESILKKVDEKHSLKSAEFQRICSEISFWEQTTSGNRQSRHLRRNLRDSLVTDIMY